MDEDGPTRRSVLRATGSLAAAGSMVATAGCMGGSGSGSDDDGSGSGSEGDSSGSDSEDGGSGSTSQNDAGGSGSEGDGGGSGSDSDLPGELFNTSTVEGLTGSTVASSTDAGYEVTITVSNDSGSPVAATTRVAWRDGKGSEPLKTTNAGTKTVADGDEITFTLPVEDPNDKITGYLAYITAHKK